MVRKWRGRTARYLRNVQIWSLPWQRHRHGALFYLWRLLLKQQPFFCKTKAFGLPAVPNMPECSSLGFPPYRSKQAEGRCNAAWQTKQHVFYFPAWPCATYSGQLTRDIKFVQPSDLAVHRSNINVSEVCGLTQKFNLTEVTNSLFLSLLF